VGENGAGWKSVTAALLGVLSHVICRAHNCSGRPSCSRQTTACMCPFFFCTFRARAGCLRCGAAVSGVQLALCSLLSMDGIAPLPYRQWVVPSGTNRALKGRAGVPSHLPSSANRASVRFVRYLGLMCRQKCVSTKSVCPTAAYSVHCVVGAGRWAPGPVQDPGLWVCCKHEMPGIGVTSLAQRQQQGAVLVCLDRQRLCVAAAYVAWWYGHHVCLLSEPCVRHVCVVMVRCDGIQPTADPPACDPLAPCGTQWARGMCACMWQNLRTA
jgi:hypothetical protein